MKNCKNHGLSPIRLRGKETWRRREAWFCHGNSQVAHCPDPRALPFPDPFLECGLLVHSLVRCSPVSHIYQSAEHLPCAGHQQGGCRDAGVNSCLRNTGPQRRKTKKSSCVTWSDPDRRKQEFSGRHPHHCGPNLPVCPSRAEPGWAFTGEREKRGSWEREAWDRRKGSRLVVSGW